MRYDRKVMPAFANASFFSFAAFAKTGGDALQARPEAAQTSADILRAFLGNETLLWGCMAMALIALFTVAKVTSRRRKAGKASRIARAQADAVHSFLNAVREGHATAKQGIWHFDFTTGEQQYSEKLRSLVSACGKELAADKQIDKALAEAGLNLPKLARNQFDQTQPYEAVFTLEGEDTPPRQMILRACNFRGKGDEVQRVVAIISEVSDTPQDLGGCE